MTQIGRLTINAEDGQLVLSGSLDETANVIDLLNQAKGGRLALDLGGVTFINSLGVRDWIRMLATAQTKGLAVELRRVSEPIVHQLNMIIATRGNATVTSFFAPYACDKCGREGDVLVAAEVGDRVDPQRLGQRGIVLLGEARERRRRRGEDLGDRLVFVGLVEGLGEVDGNCHSGVLSCAAAPPARPIPASLLHAAQRVQAGATADHRTVSSP